MGPVLEAGPAVVDEPVEGGPVVAAGPGMEDQLVATTLMESIWMAPSRSRVARRAAGPAGVARAGAASPWAARATRRAWSEEKASGIWQETLADGWNRS